MPVAYAEIVASIASRSAGPGTRANIDEFTETTAAAIEQVGGAARGKALIILNPVKPPMIMRDTVFCAIPDGADQAAITASIEKRVAEVQDYVPGYTLRAEPQYDEPRDDWDGQGRVAVFLEVRGNGNAPTEVLVATFDRLGIPTGIDVQGALAAAEDVVRPILPSLPFADRGAITQGYAGSTPASCCTHSAPPRATASRRTRSCSGSARPATSAVRKT